MSALQPLGLQAGKIHSELGILSQSSNQNSNQSSSNTGLAPMEIDWFEKGKNKGKSKGKSKGKDTSKGKGKNKSDKGKVSPTRAPLVLQLPASNACTAASMAASSLIVGNFMDIVIRRMSTRLNPMLRTTLPALLAILQLPVALLALLVLLALCVFSLDSMRPLDLS